MSYDFNADDIFEMALQMERNGAEFYKNAAQGPAADKHQDFLLDLARMEEAHEKTFAKLQKDLSGSEKAATVFDPSGESTLYLKALVDTRVFFEKKIDVSSFKEILKAAITAEKDSIVFYLGMKDLVPEKLGKDRIDEIIREEMGHVRLLAKKLLNA
ncbi:Rubrerythrin [Candidatus Desulfarcum epimagneticum]|uniref:Rubrerythrin n=1 Tax=uncultured Desulfobacteraceae bacterium TaxID=218296 RepID=A0A484HIB1_9BACT|nr:Rubrerythrin [uncultured Desulfobacteraceae bacterium]